jgi:hypothetical protein
LRYYFEDHIIKFAQEKQIAKEELLRQIREWYNGYRFSIGDQTVYNPFSTLLLFKENIFRNYWFESGTPSFLIKLLKQKEYNLDSIVGQDYGEAAFGSYEIDNLDVVPLFFQTGYLTISDCTEISIDQRFYRLDFPNNEVRRSFNEYIIENYSQTRTGSTATSIYSIRQAIQAGNLDKMFELMKTFFATIPYTINLKNEKYYQTIFFSIFTLLGLDIEVECSTNKGRIDAVVKVENKVYIFEFKLHGTAEDALKQIKEREYYQKYTSPPSPLLGKEREGRAEGVVGEVKDTLAYQKDYSLPTTNYQLFLIGVNFSTEEKNIKNFVIEQVT